MKTPDILARILAYMDALLLPEPGEKPDFRSLSNRRSQHVQDYNARGLPWHPAFLDPDRSPKQAERDLSQLIMDGCIKTPSVRRREHVRLTPYGHAYARLLVGWNASIDKAFSVMEAMSKAGRRAAWWHGRPWFMIEVNADSRPQILFALGQGYIQAESDAEGRVLFAITAGGEDALRSKQVPDVCAEAVPGLMAVYRDAYRQALKIVRELPLLNPSDLHLFLPVSGPQQDHHTDGGTGSDSEFDCNQMGHKKHRRTHALE